MKDFLRSMFGGAVGAAAAITLRTLLPWWLYLIIGVVCCVASLMEIGTLACCIVRHERRMMRQRGREDEVPH